MSADGLVDIIQFDHRGVPTSFRLSNFDVDAHALKPAHRLFLADTIARILTNGQSQVILVGRASRSGDPRQNLALSRRRAEEVRDYLVNEQQIEAARIVMGRHLGEGAPLSTDVEAEIDRSVDISLDIRLPRSFVLGLQNASLVRPTEVLWQRMREIWEPIVRDAGRELDVITSVDYRSGTFTSQPDVVMVFSRVSHPSAGPVDLSQGHPEAFGPGAHHMALGNEGTGVFVDVWLDQRAYRAPRMLFLAPRSLESSGTGPRFAQNTVVDYNLLATPLFDNGEREFALAIANTATHELGHVLALGHVCSPLDNYMFTLGRNECGRNGQAARELQNFGRIALRDFWAGDNHFDAAQRRTLMVSIALGRYFREGSRITSTPAATPRGR